MQLPAVFRSVLIRYQAAKGSRLITAETLNGGVAAWPKQLLVTIRKMPKSGGGVESCSWWGGGGGKKLQ